MVGLRPIFCEEIAAACCCMIPDFLGCFYSIDLFMVVDLRFGLILVCFLASRPPPEPAPI